MSVDGFGAPKHTADRKTFPEGLKDGVQEERVLPPILSQVETGRYNLIHACHYGYATKSQRGDKEIITPFYCVEKGNWVGGKFVVLEDCPECEEIKRVKSEKEVIEADMKRLGKLKEDVDAAVDSHAQWLRKHNKDVKEYVNVKSADGRFFTRKYPKKEVWGKIKAFIEKYKSNSVPIDAIAADQGLAFRITRYGKGINSEYNVEVVTEDVPGVPGAQKPKLVPLTSEDAKKAQTSCMDLAEVGIRRLSREQVARLVASRGDATVVEAVFAGSDQVHREPESRPSVAPVAKQHSAVAAAAATVPGAGASVTTSHPPKQDQGASNDELIRRARSLVGQVGQTSTPPASAPPEQPKQQVQPPTAAPSSVATSSPADDFMAQFTLPTK